MSHDLECEKQLFWNTLVSKLKEHLVYKCWSKNGKRGTEGMLKDTELMIEKVDNRLLEGNDDYQV